MATRAEMLRPGTWPQPDDELLTRYMRALLRNGWRSGVHEDMRTCGACGSYARFDPSSDNSTWSTCSACGELS